MDLIAATQACTVILQYVVGTNLSWRKEGEELVPACKSVCGNMHAQTKPVSMLLPVYVAAALSSSGLLLSNARHAPSLHTTLPELRGSSGKGSI